MPKPKKKKDETWAEYRNKLVKHYIEEGYPREQAIAIAYSVVEKKKKEKRKR